MLLIPFPLHDFQFCLRLLDLFIWWMKKKTRKRKMVGIHISRPPNIYYNKRHKSNTLPNLDFIRQPSRMSFSMFYSCHFSHSILARSIHVNDFLNYALTQSLNKKLNSRSCANNLKGCILTECGVGSIGSSFYLWTSKNWKFKKLCPLIMFTQIAFVIIIRLINLRG